MKYKISCLILILLIAFGSVQAEKRVDSPDGKLSVILSADNGKPVYHVVYNEKTFMKQSPLGLLTNVGDFTQGLTLSEDVKVSRIDETYELPNIKKSKVHYVANQAIMTFLKDGKSAFDVIFNVSNNNIAYRYMVYPQGENLSCVISSEATGFVFPEGTTTFLCPQSKPMGGFARTSPSYETEYTPDAPMGQNGYGEGYSFPCLFKVSGDGWVLISETGVNGSYCGSRLLGHADGLYTIGFPQKGENNGNGTSSPGISLPGKTPWRTITVGETLAPIVETTIPFDVVEPLYEASQKYQYGKGTWSWIIGMDASMNYDEQKRYIDFSAELGYQSLLVDALWDKEIGYEKMGKLAKYAASKDVALYLWYNSNGYWNDAPQTPKGKMDNSIARRKEMAWMKSIGIRGIKVDFFGGDKQVTMQLYQDILYDANDYGLLVIFHGCTLPRGWERMYPNYAASEAVLASEMLHFSQDMCNKEAFNTSMHPFIRNAVGSMDFGGSTLNEYYNKTNSGDQYGGHRLTTDVFALAAAVLFQSGVQHFALAPNNLTDAPDWALDFMKKVPTLWDETMFIDGYPGKYIILARKSKDTWYIAAVNAQKEPFKQKIKLPMIPGKETIKLYSDKQPGGSVSDVKLSKKQEIELEIPENGGALIVY